MSTVVKSNDLCYLTIAEASAGLRRKDYSPVDLTEACLERIEALDGKLHSFITITAESARAQARQAEQEFASAQRARTAARHSNRAQRSLHDEGHPHDLPFGRAGELGSRLRCDGGFKTRRGWHDPTRQTWHARIRFWRPVGRRAFSRGAQSVEYLHTFPAVRAAAPAPRSLRDFVTARSAPTPAARFVPRRPTVALSASSQPTAGSAVMASYR